jgi:hypothetical protein
MAMVVSEPASSGRAGIQYTIRVLNEQCRS